MQYENWVISGLLEAFAVGPPGDLTWIQVNQSIQ